MPTTLVPRSGYRAVAAVVADYFGLEIPVEAGMSNQIKIYQGKESPVVIAWVYIQSRPVLIEGTQYIREYCLRVFGEVIPIIYVIDFVSERLRELLSDELQVYWMDMSGNGLILLPDVQIIHYGNPNRYASDRTRDNPTTPAAAKVLKQLLLNPSQLGVRKAAAAAGVDQGLASRVVKQLVEHGWAEVNRHAGKVALHSPMNILKYWRQKHVFNTTKLQVYTAHIEDPQVDRITDVLTTEGYDYAWTMMPAAWAYHHFGEYQEYTVYLDRMPRSDLSDYLELDLDSKTPNLRVIVNPRPDTFEDLSVLDGITYVNPFRAYCDLKESKDPEEPMASKVLRNFIKAQIIQR